MQAYNNRYLLFAAIAVAYIFSYILHLSWISWAATHPEFFWNSQLMINNTDGYFYGSAAQHIVNGLHADNPRLTGAYGYGTAVITAYLSKFLHVSIDTMMLYLPAFVSSLVVIPIVLIGKLYDRLGWGFFSALAASVGWSYYNRTLAGYYDTDMFSAMLPMFILYFLLGAIKHRSLNFLLGASISVILYPWLYEQGLSIIYATGIVMFGYLLYFHRHERFSYEAVILFSFALMPIFWALKLVVVLGLWFGLRRIELKEKQLQIVAGVSFVIFLISGNVLGIILHKIFSYTAKGNDVLGLHFLNVNETVREAGKIPFEVVANRIVGSSLALILAVGGYILLLVRKKEFIVALPLWGIGFFAYIGGLRFTVYAVPVAAMSAVYFFVWLSQKYENKKISLGIVSLGTLLVLAPNISHIKGCCEKTSWLDGLRSFYPLKSRAYLVPTTFTKSEVALLDRLRKKSSPKDYVITWWDYGYPIWYYGNVNTLIDGGKHNEDNYLVSKILTASNQQLAANLSKLSIEKYVDTNKTVAPQLFVRDKKPVAVASYLYRVASAQFQAPKLDRNVYIMLPRRMLDIFPTVAYFSQRDLNSGELYKRAFYYKNRIAQKGKYLFVGQLAIDLQKAVIRVGSKEVPIKSFVTVAFRGDGQSVVNKQDVRQKGFSVIIDKTFGEGLIVENYYLNSLFFQLYFFDNYDKNLFEPVVTSPWMKIYKLR